MKKNNVSLKYNVEKLQNDIKAVTPRSQGNLANSIQITGVQKSDAYTVELQALDYFQYVDQGRKPGKFPPPTTIRNWVNKNLHPSIKEANSLTYLVSKKIARYGTKGADILKNIKFDSYLVDYEVNLEV